MFKITPKLMMPNYSNDTDYLIVCFKQFKAELTLHKTLLSSGLSTMSIQRWLVELACMR